MEQHTHNTYEIIHGDIPINEWVDSLDYDQAQSSKDIERTNIRINELIEVLLTLEIDSSTRFVLQELLAK